MIADDCLDDDPTDGVFVRPVGPVIDVIEGVDIESGEPVYGPIYGDASEQTGDEQ